MKTKSKKITLNLPHVHLFLDYHDIPLFAKDINSMIEGKNKIQYQELGCLDGEYVGIFYLDKDEDYIKLCNQYKIMIDEAEEGMVRV